MRRGKFPAPFAALRCRALRAVIEAGGDEKAATAMFRCCIRWVDELCKLVAQHEADWRFIAALERGAAVLYKKHPDEVAGEFAQIDAGEEDRIIAEMDAAQPAANAIEASHAAPKVKPESVPPPAPAAPTLQPAKREAVAPALHPATDSNPAPVPPPAATFDPNPVGWDNWPDEPEPPARVQHLRPGKPGDTRPLVKYVCRCGHSWIAHEGQKGWNYCGACGTHKHNSDITMVRLDENKRMAS